GPGGLYFYSRNATRKVIIKENVMPMPAIPAKLKVPFYGHGRQYHNIKKEIDDAFHAVMESEAYVMGPTPRFEKELAQYFAMKHAVGLNSGTDALWIAF